MAKTTIQPTAFGIGKSGVYECNPNVCVREHEITVSVEPGRNGWYNVSATDDAGERNPGKRTQSWGYSSRDNRWSYSVAPPAFVVDAARSIGLPIRADAVGTTHQVA